VHPLQLDVIERCLTLWSNPGENVITPFMGVGSEVCGALVNERRGVGIELKPSYFRQALNNIDEVIKSGWGAQEQAFAFEDPEPLLVERSDADAQTVAD
jgi:DNA modification methylase